MPQHVRQSDHKASNVITIGRQCKHRDSSKAGVDQTLISNHRDDCDDKKRSNHSSQANRKSADHVCYGARFDASAMIMTGLDEV